MADKKVKKTKTKKHMAREQREARQTRIIITITAVVAVLVLGLVIYGLIDQVLVRPRRPVARVGENYISVGEFETTVQYTRVQLLNQTFQYYSFAQQFGEFGQSFLQTAQSLAQQLAQPVPLGREVLDEMIDNVIIREEAARLDITASEQEIDEAIQAAFGFFPDGTPTPTTTATIQPTPTFSETQLALVTLTFTPTPVELEQEGINETPSPVDDDDTETVDDDETIDESLNDNELEEPIEPGDMEDEFEPLEDVDLLDATPTPSLTPTPYTTQAFGENIREFNQMYSPYNFDIDNLREVFEVQILREKLLEVVTQDMIPIREEVWARHILVETLEEALEVLELLDEGEDFHELAAIYSTDEGNREQGGDLGWFDRDTMVPTFSETAFDLTVGQISEPVETAFGFHIIQVLGQRENQIPPQEFAQQRIIAFNAWVREQRNARDDIEIFENWETFVPTSPEVPQQLLIELFQQQQQILPPTTP